MSIATPRRSRRPWSRCSTDLTLRRARTPASPARPAIASPPSSSPEERIHDDDPTRDAGNAADDAADAVGDAASGAADTVGDAAGDARRPREAGRAAPPTQAGDTAAERLSRRRRRGRRGRRQGRRYRQRSRRRGRRCGGQGRRGGHRPDRPAQEAAGRLTALGRFAAGGTLEPLELGGQVERPAVLAAGRRLGVDPRDRAVRGVDDAGQLDPGTGDGRAGSVARRAREQPVALVQQRPGGLVRFDPGRRGARRCAASGRPAPSRPPLNRPRAAAARPGAGGRRRRPPPWPRGSCRSIERLAHVSRDGRSGSGSSGLRSRRAHGREDSAALTGKLTRGPSIVDACS